ncbi:MAG: hypothetical protein JSR91_00245 [Proteobacteria bacterium]|nr:hypothetical protein [Pseudomonadota bacterium]
MTDTTQAGTVDTASPSSDDKPIPTPGVEQGAQDVKAGSSPAPADAAAKDPNEEDGDKSSKSGGGFQNRIKELTRREAEANRRADRLEEMLSKAIEGREQPRRQEADAEQPPRPDQFKTYEEYLEARADWRADQRVKAALKEARGQTQQRQEEESFASRVASFNDTVAKEGKDIEGFAEAHAALTAPVDEGGPEVHPAIADFLVSEAENKAQMVKYLGENLDEVAKLNRMHPRSLINRLARLDAQLGAKPAAKTSNAPPPPPTVNGRSAPQVDITKMNMDEYAKHRGFA